MQVDRFVHTELVVEYEQPFVQNLTELLDDWGLTDASQEALWVIAFDSIGQIRIIEEVAKGGYHELDVPLPALLTTVLLAGTDRFQIAHNHPSGDTSPTMADMEMTHMVMAAANTVGVYFEDHWIVGPDGAPYSMLANGLIVPSQKLVEMASGKAHRRVAERTK